MTAKQNTTPRRPKGVKKDEFDSELQIPVRAFMQGRDFGREEGRQDVQRERYRLSFEDMDQWDQSLHRAAALADLLYMAHLDNLDKGTVNETAGMLVKELKVMRDLEKLARRERNPAPTEAAANA